MGTDLRKQSATLLILAILAFAACREANNPPPSQGIGLAVQVASYDLAIGTQRFIAGILTPESEFVSYGTVEMSFAYTGTRESPTSEVRFSKSQEASFLAIPGETLPQPQPLAPIAGPASQGRGVYGTEASFDRAGIWQVRVQTRLSSKRVEGASSFEVLEEHGVPAVGDQAPRTENLTMNSDAPKTAIDSLAQTGEIPDPELHQMTIAQSISAGRPSLVVFSTPVYCVSRFCGPVTDLIDELASQYGNRATFIHIEIWRDFGAKTINKAAADWLLKGDDLQEPWVFLIGGDGVIKARWDNVATRGEIEPLLQALPVLPG